MKKTVFTGVLALFLCIAAPASAETLDLLCFNVWSGLDSGGLVADPSLEEPGSREFRRELLERGIEALEPDLLGLLELNPLPAAVRELEERFDLNGVWQIDRGGVRIGPVGLPLNRRQGMALLVREDLDLSERGVRKLSGGGLGSWYQIGDTGIVLSAVVQVGSTRLHLFITHWEETLYDDEEALNALVAEYSRGDGDAKDLLKQVGKAAEGGELRRRQAAAALDYINQTAGREPAILMGTLAAAPGSEVLDLIKQAGFRDTWTLRGGATWDEANNPNTLLSGRGDLFSAGERGDRVDYVLIRGDGIRSLGSRIVFNEPTYGTWPSDHYGLLVRLEVDGKK
jgi:Endonuclease/Exonuclease/phosphatase family